MIEHLFEPYNTYSTLHIVLEVLAVIFAIASVLYSKNNNIKVYPYGVLSTSIFVYLLYEWELFGDLIINIYFLIMSVYGWYLWYKPTINKQKLKISVLEKKEYSASVLIFIFSSLFVALVYFWFDKFGVWWSYPDILTSGLFFVGMYLLAKRKVEHWLFLILGDIISIPLYYYKGYTITSMLYIAYTIIAIFGYLEWKKIWNKEKTLSE